MATLIPLAINDARNVAFQHMGGDKKALGRSISKWANTIKNPAQSAWKSFKGVFGLGIYIPTSSRIKAKPRPRPRGRPRKKK
jgi:hypothetical protein